MDDLSGTVHRAYGSMPNMTWVIDRGGRVVYKANWTGAANVEVFVDRYIATRDQRRAGIEQVPYETEQIEFRGVDRERFQERLARNGPSSVREWDNARKLWSQRAAANARPSSSS